MVWCKSKTDHFYWEKKKYHFHTFINSIWFLGNNLIKYPWLCGIIKTIICFSCNIQIDFEEIFRLAHKRSLKYRFWFTFIVFFHFRWFVKIFLTIFTVSNLLCVISCFLKYVLHRCEALHRLRFEYYAVCQKSDQFLSFILYYFREGQYRMFVSLLLSGVSVCSSMCSVCLLSLYGNTTFSGSISNVSSATMWLVQVLDGAHRSCTSSLSSDYKLQLYESVYML